MPGIEKFMMIYENNTLNGSHMCYVPGFPSMYYFDKKKEAINFIDKFNSNILFGLNTGKYCIENNQLKSI